MSNPFAVSNVGELYAACAAYMLAAKYSTASRAQWYCLRIEHSTICPVLKLLANSSFGPLPVSKASLRFPMVLLDSNRYPVVYYEFRCVSNRCWRYYGVCQNSILDGHLQSQINQFSFKENPSVSIEKINQFSSRFYVLLQKS